MIYDQDFTVRIWDPRHLRRRCPECGSPLKTKGARLCSTCHCRKVGRAQRMDPS